jgi:hypothetical protein
MKEYLSAEVAVTAALQASTDFELTPADELGALGTRVTPRELADFLGRLRLLEGVPFSYLVPDPDLLPLESARFFFLDRAWTDALVQGALSVGTVTTADHAQLEKVYPAVRDELDQVERLIRMPGGEPTPDGAARTITGFLLRSRAVSGWPALHVRAYLEELGGPDDGTIPESDPRRLKLMRMERLAPAVLLVLIDGVPAVVHVEEPRQGIQFGYRVPDPPGADPNVVTALVPPRDITTGEQISDDQRTWVTVAFRRGSAGVVNMRSTRDRLLNAPGTHMGTSVDSAEYAIQMLRYPYRQVFGDPSVQPPPVGDVFRPTLGLADLRQRFQEAQR